MCGKTRTKTSEYQLSPSSSSSSSQSDAAHQSLVYEAEHVGVVQEDVSRVSGVEGDVGDGRVPLQPHAVQPVLLNLPTPVRVLFLQQGELEDLQRTGKHNIRSSL